MLTNDTASASTSVIDFSEATPGKKHHSDGDNLSPLLNAVETLSASTQERYCKFFDASVPQPGFLKRFKAWLTGSSTPQIVEQESQRVFAEGSALYHQGEDYCTLLEEQQKILPPQTNAQGLLALAVFVLTGAAGFLIGRYSGTSGNPSTDINGWSNYSRESELPTAAGIVDNRSQRVRKSPQLPKDVRIENILDLTQLAELNKPRFADSLDAIIKMLTKMMKSLEGKPVTTHSVNTANIEKLPVETLQKLNAIIEPIDEILFATQPMLPGVNLLTITQYLLIPALRLVVNDCKKIDPDSKQRMEITGQVAFMLRQLIPTLTENERAVLYGKPNPNIAKSIVTRRFSFVDRTPHIKIDSKTYKLDSGENNIPLIHQEDDITRFVRFNQKRWRWETMIGYQIQANYKYNDESADKYGIYFGEKSVDATLELRSAASRPDIFILKRAGKPTETGVFVHNHFVPVIQRQSGKDWLTIVTVNGFEEVLLEKTDHGWIFEPKSVPIDRYLQMMLERKNTLDTGMKGKQLGLYSTQGISRDRLNRPFIKQNNRYYELTQLAAMQSYSLKQYGDSVIKYENGVLKLKEDENTLFSLSISPIGIRAREKQPGQYIETAAKKYINENAVRVAPSDIGTVERAQPGIYTGKDKSLYFVVDNNYYWINGYSNTQINIIRKHSVSSFNNIVLKLSGNTWIRVREGTEKYKYNELGKCANDATTGCLSVVVEENLEKLLIKHIPTTDTYMPSPLVTLLDPPSLYDTPSLYLDPRDQNYYYEFHSYPFLSKIIEKNDKNNPTEFPLIQLYSKGRIFDNSELIATIVSEKKNDSYEIKEQATLLSEQWNVNKSIAEEYIRKVAWREIIGIRSVEDAVNEVVAADLFYIAKPKINYLPKMSQQDIDKRIREMFQTNYFNDITYDIKTIPLSDTSQSLTAEQQAAQIHVKQKIEYVKQFLIPSLREALLFFDSQVNWQPCMEYLCEILGTDNEDFANDFASTARNILQRIADNIDTNKIRLLTIVNASNALPASDSTLMRLTAEKEYYNDAIFITPDKDCEIYINLDKIYTFDHTKKRPPVDLVHALLSGVARSGQMLHNFFETPNTEGVYAPIRETLQQMTSKIRIGEIYNIKKFKDISADDYIKKVTVYLKKYPEILLNEDLSFLFQFDPGYRANVILKSADIFASVVRDLYEATVFGISSPKDETGISYSKPERFINRDTPGTIFDNKDGYFIKDYNNDAKSGDQTYLGTWQTNYNSRLQVAMNNVNCLQRIHGPASAHLIINSADNTVSVKMLKKPGLPLSDLYEMEQTLLEREYSSALIDFIINKPNPAEELADKLINKGVSYQQIAPDDLIFDKDKGFSILSYDFAILYSEGEKVPQTIANETREKLKAMLAAFAVYAGLPGETVIQKLGITDSH